MISQIGRSLPCTDAFFWRRDAARSPVGIMGQTPGGLTVASVFAGILRCGQCGRKVLVYYSGLQSRSIRYSCSTTVAMTMASAACRFLPMRWNAPCLGNCGDRESSGVEAALKAAEILAVEGHTLREQRELELTQARYESERTRQQYNSVDPAHRLVASELERRWNEALLKVASLEEELQAIVVEDPVSDEERQALLALGQDLAGVWDNPATSPEVKKRIARTLVKEIVLFDEGRRH